MQPIPAVGLDSVGVERLVAGDAPDIGGHAVFLLQNFLGAEGFVQDRAAAEKLRAQLRFLIREARNLYMPLRMPSVTSPGISGMAYGSFITVM